MLHGRSASALALWAFCAGIGCGARTTLNDDAYGLAAGNGGRSGNGGSATGGSAANSNGDSAGGGGTGAVDGTGGGDGRARLSGACENLCGPYTDACPGEYDDASDCAVECLEDFGDQPRRCRDTGVEALNCLAGNIEPEFGCEFALLSAIDACIELVEAADRCVATDGGDGVEPAPPPRPSPPAPAPAPACSGTSTAGPNDCSITSSCAEQGTFYITCYRVEEGESTCACYDSFASSSEFIANVPISDACEYARALCGYP